ncbi:MAG: hypothetical protein U7126_21170 [Microcoleus sp.]|uniref:hypothetical protein n=1 Tax=Microcoleus anatoxicus TaxID=2705319 RepID=UPI0035E9E86B
MSQTEAITKLKKAGLLVEPNCNIPDSDGYTIVKPASISGNSRKNWEEYFGAEEILFDAPSASLYSDNDKWTFQIWESVPGPGIGDFQMNFSSIMDAVEAILDYYFGDPSKMNPPELIELE